MAAGKQRIRPHITALLMLLAVGLAFFALVKWPESGPAAPRSAKATDDDFSTPQTTGAAEIQVQPAVNQRPSSGIGDQESAETTTPADIVVELRGPQGWPSAIACSVWLYTRAGEKRVGPEIEDGGSPLFPTHAPETESAAIDAVSVSIPPNDICSVPIRVPKGGLGVRIRGEGIVTIGIEYRWDGVDAIRSLYSGFIADNVSSASWYPSERHPLLPANGLETVLQRGATQKLSVSPLVPVTAVLTDMDDREFLTLRSVWYLRWKMKFADGAGEVYAFPMTGIFAAPSGTPPPLGNPEHIQVQAAPARFLVPTGAELEITRLSRWGGGEPDAYKRTVPPDPEGLRLRFRMPVRLLTLRVFSHESKVLSTAQVQGCSRVELLPKDSVEGTLTVVLREGRSEFRVWAPNHLSHVVSTLSVPTDGSVLDVSLTSAVPGLILRVDFADDPDNRKLVTVCIRDSSDTGRTRDIGQGRQVHFKPWDFEIPLPEEGEVIVKAEPESRPSAEPKSQWYQFELVEYGTEGGVRMHRYLARPMIGILVKNLEQTVLGVEIAHGLPKGPIKEGNWRVQPGVVRGLEPGEEWLAPVGPGEWLVRLRRSPDLAAQISVTVRDESVEVNAEMRPRQPGWRLLKVIDSTGVCGAEGTAFMTGLPVLKDVPNVQEGAIGLAAFISRSREYRKRDNQDPDTIDWQTCQVQGIVFVSAHKPGLVMAPTWFTGRVAVLPPAGPGLYEGVIDTEAGTVNVSVPAWTAEVAFTPPPMVTAEQSAILKEKGWFVAIREYRDLRDLNTIDGMDMKVPAPLGSAKVPALPPGTYVARYVRAGEELFEDPRTGMQQVRIRMEWFNAVKFEVRSGTVLVEVPVERD